ncbi:hypothetical protein PIB30_113351, partial [Stylosanthes scabra]|nr:hypothetical protein [Stylosanthes scabra]
MKDGEGVEVTLEKLNRIINSLKMLGNTFTEEEIVDKASKEDREKKYKKKNAYISWENEESESSDEDENANICLMAKGDE